MFKKTKLKSSKRDYVDLSLKLANFDALPYTPIDFTITTKNSSAKFNSLILSDISSVISEHLKENRSCLQYHLDIDDDLNVLSKFEQVLREKNIIIDSSESRILKNIFLNLKIEYQLPPQNINKISLYIKLPSAELSQDSVQNFFQKQSNQIFTIKTKKRSYLCNIFGVLSSSVIRDTFSQDKTTFLFDFDDDGEEFDHICKLFNYEEIILTNRNVDSIKEIAEKLGIDCIFNLIENFLDEKEKKLKIIDDKQSTIDSIDNIFDLLYHIKEKSVESVARSIFESEWSKSENNIFELVAFIFQVASSSIQLHPYLIDLLLKLDESKDKEKSANQLNLLMPFFVKQSMFLFSVKLKEMNSYDLFFPFFYLLYKRGIVPKEKVDEILKDCSLDYNYFVFWFLPELIELNQNSDKIKVIKSNVFIKSQSKLLNPDGFQNQKAQKKQIGFGLEKTAQKKQIGAKSFDYFCPKVADLDEYIKMRDRGDNGDEIAKILRNDDIDSFQSIVSKNPKFLTNEKIKSNIFEPFFCQDMNYLNYAAAYGSIKCFKYMLLNECEIDEFTFEMAVYGGNNELIRIVDNEKFDYDRRMKTNKRNQRGQRFNDTNTQNPIVKALIRSIGSHKNDIFEWILEQKFEIINNEFILLTLAASSIENGNIHSLVHLIDNDFDISSSSSYSSKSIIISIGKAVQKGFYSLVSLLIDLYQQYISSIDIKCIVCSNNICILKLFTEVFSNKKNAQNALLSAFDLGSVEIIDYLIDFIEKNHYFDEFLFIKLLKCKLNNDRLQKIAQIIHDSNSNTDFTEIIIHSIENELNELAIFIINNNYKIDYPDLISKCMQINNIGVEIFSLIMSKLDSELKKNMINKIDYFITNKNKPIVEFLLQQDASIENSLIKAVNINDLEIVDLILKKNSEPSYINKNSIDGTALIIAVKNNNLNIVNKLLSIKGIDPNISDEKFDTPLLISIKKSNIDIFDSLIKYYGDDIQNQKWQLENGVKFIIFNKSNDNKHQNMKHAMKNESKILLKIIKLHCINPNLGNSIDNIFNYSLQHKCINVIQELLKYENFDVNLVDENTGDTFLIKAINIPSVFDLLIKNPKINVDTQNYEKKSALIYAVMKENVNLYEPIINLSKDSDQFIEALKIAIRINIDIKSIIELIKLSVKFDIDYSAPIINGHSIFEEIINKELDLKTIHFIMNSPNFDSHKIDIIKCFTDAFEKYAKCKNINKLSNSSNFAINLMNLLYEFDCSHDHLIESKLNEKDSSLLQLIDNNINPNEVNGNDLYPFEDAIINNSYVLAFCLIKLNKVDLNTKILVKREPFNNYTTYLHIAIENKRPKIIKEILTNHLCDINVVNSNNETPLFEACKSLQSDCVKLLFERDDLNFTYRNDNSEDVFDFLKRLTKSDKSAPKNKDEYLSELLLLIDDIKKHMFKVENVKQNKNNFGLNKIYSFKESKEFTGGKFTFVQDKESDKSKNLKFISHKFSNSRSEKVKTDINQNQKHSLNRISGFKFTDKSHTTQSSSGNFNFNFNPEILYPIPKLLEIGPTVHKVKQAEQQPKSLQIIFTPKSHQRVGLSAKKPANPELNKLNGASAITKEKIASKSTKLNPVEQQPKSVGFKFPPESNQSIKSNRLKLASSNQCNLDGAENSNKTKQAAVSDAIKPTSSEDQNFVISHDQEKCQTLSNSSHLPSSSSKSNEKITKVISSSQKVKFVIHNESFSEKPDPSFNSIRKSGNFVNDDRKISQRIFDEVENEVNDFDFCCQPQILDNNQMMMLQQQQQQWFQMIQMNNDFQAKINFLMMNQTSFNLNKSMKKKKEKESHSKHSKKSRK